VGARTTDELVGALDVRRIVGGKLGRVEVTLAQIALLAGQTGEEVEVAEAVRHQATIRPEVI